MRVTAAEQFQCGQKNNIALTNALISDHKGSTSVNILTPNEAQLKSHNISCQLPSPVAVGKIPMYRNCDLFDNTHRAMSMLKVIFEKKSLEMCLLIFNFSAKFRDKSKQKWKKYVYLLSS